MSSDSPKGQICIKVRVAVVDKKTGEESQVHESTRDMSVANFIYLSIDNIFGRAQVAVDITGTNRSITANTAVTAVNVVAGTGTTSPLWSDYALQTPVSGGAGSATAIIGAYSGSGSSGSFTISGNMSSPNSTTVYHEVGIYLTLSGYQFMIAHDVSATGWSVDTSHYLAVTYTITQS
jgi:hypothetical protein